MFYLKTKLATVKVITTDITDENIFTLCGECGRELPVDLAEVFADGEGDLFSTSILCSSCTRRRPDKRRHTDGIKITIDGIALLSDVLCQAGYGEQVYDLFVEYELESVHDLVPEQYESFTNTLRAFATHGGSI